MHELSICQSLVSQLNDIAGQHPGKKVSVVRILIGPLSGVDPALLAQSFPFASAGTPAEQAVLECQNGPVRIYCPECEVEANAEQNFLTCQQCGNWKTSLISGDELLLQQVELEDMQKTTETIH